MQVSYKAFYYAMVITLIVIGIFQFFSLPKYLDYVLLIIAILFGIIGWIKRSKVQ